MILAVDLLYLNYSINLFSVFHNGKFAVLDRIFVNNARQYLCFRNIMTLYIPLGELIRRKRSQITVLIILCRISVKPYAQKLLPERSILFTHLRISACAGGQRQHSRKNYPNQYFSYLHYRISLISRGKSCRISEAIPHKTRKISAVRCCP